MRYCYEGSNGGYPIESDQWDRDWLTENEYHLCIFCGEKSHEDGMLRTPEGWACKECNDYQIELNQQQ